ncbi:MAG: radical SAM protein [Candidatus Brockarchaeota archaeon]|nr:radical SAM protein [Candidatus Brockarchaeota archaeon]
MYAQVCKVIDNIEYRKYYRFRGGRWYGGIATGDVVGCNLKCRFCWSWRQRDNALQYGKFYDSSQVCSRLVMIANKRGYHQVRLSGGEPTISRRHLFGVIEYFLKKGLHFILETNGILIGYDRSYAEQLSEYKNVHVRVSLKGVCEEEFHRLTGADPNAFNFQINALKNLLEYEVSCHPAIMLSFSEKKEVQNLVDKLRSIDTSLVNNLEEEYIFLYPHVVEILNKYGLKPKVAYSLNNMSTKLI